MKKAIFELQNNGGSYKIKIIGDLQNKTWDKMNNEIIFDNEKRAIENDLKADGYKTITK